MFYHYTLIRVHGRYRRTVILCSCKIVKVQLLMLRIPCAKVM